MELVDVLIGAEFLAALIGIIYFKRLKNSYWKWFSVYLVIIFISEFFWYLFADQISSSIKQIYFGVFVFPFQFMFLIWLYAMKSLKNKKLFIVCTILYVVTIPFYLENINPLFTINYAVGTTIIAFLVVMEFIKQLKNDDILKFKENKMFYINIGVILFFVGNFPLFAFYYTLYCDYVEIWNFCFLYFRITSSLLYLLFIASFIWGKHQTS